MQPSRVSQRARLAALVSSLLTAFIFSSNAVSDSNYPIAGLQPDQRPATAPTIQQYQKDANWYRQALHGVTPPYPASLQFLENQGAWHTPFTQRGMPGPYDIRGWYSGK